MKRRRFVQSLAAGAVALTASVRLAMECVGETEEPFQGEVFSSGLTQEKLEEIYRRVTAEGSGWTRIS